jgi:hypothetical protein
MDKDDDNQKSIQLSYELFLYFFKNFHLKKYLQYGAFTMVIHSSAFPCQFRLFSVNS